MLFFSPLWIQQDSTTCGKFWNSCKRWISSCRKICRFVRCATFSTLFKFASSQIRPSSNQRNLYSIPHVILSLRPWFCLKYYFAHILVTVYATVSVMMEIHSFCVAKPLTILWWLEALVTTAQTGALIELNVTVLSWLPPWCLVSLSRLFQVIIQMESADLLS